MTVEIDNRLYNDFVQWSDANGFPESYVTEYVNKAFRDRFMTDKYGDLNEKFSKPEPHPEPNPEPVLETPPSPKDEPSEPSMEYEQQEEPVIDTKPKTRKKVLKSK